ncbi:MAG TPA: response regulator [Ktedonobacter sp.]|nr:response regulator [Ktedonobacter sp.]
MNKTKDVLIADDNEAIVEALTLMLEDVGYSIRALPTGASYEVMLEIIQQDVPGVLLLDIWMSGKDGRDICKYLKNQQATRNLPIILVSAKSDLQRIAQESGADDYLAKPFGMKEVVAKVGKYLMV